jgi:hypothetical protein
VKLALAELDPADRRRLELALPALEALSDRLTRGRP